MILACSIVGVGVGDVIIHLVWVTALMFAIGWMMFVRPMKFEDLRAQNMGEDPDFDLHAIAWTFGSRFCLWPPSSF